MPPATKDIPAAAASPSPPVSLTQRGRAGLDILAAMLKYSSVGLRDAARQSFESAPEGKALIEQWATQDDIADGLRRAKALANADPMYRMERFVQRYVAEEMMTRNLIATEERRPDHERLASLPRQGAGGTLELDETLEIPAYYQGVNYHLAVDGTDDYDLGSKGSGIGMVFRYGGFAAVPPGTNIGRQRLDVLEEFHKDRYDRIMEIGCGGVFTLMALRRAFPEAELVGCDLNTRYLVNGHDMAERMGLAVHLKQRDARQTGEPDSSFDAVFSYAVHHEAPKAVNLEMFAEVLRILKPGGDFLISDPPPFRAVDPFHAVILDWDTDHREEPFFTEALLSDWDAELRRIGFVDVESYAIGPNSYPWVTRARKPAA